jgi:serine/threonine protein kinase/TolB-like protein/Tfp pilus assembly protein PilF
MGAALHAGQVLGHYRLLERLGEGGMGVVWRAEDTRLQRQIALKFLLADAAHDSARRQRFEQEARAAAALSHPRIATVHELTGADDQIFIVFEYVPGTTLRTSIVPGGISTENLLGIAADIADALAVAHAAGVVHRDLKPENVMRMPSGHCKVLDFGLARISVAPTSDGVTRSYLTSAGMVLGTVGYMAPEQLEGKPADFRADIFAFGTLLYELATGVHPFHGSSPASTIVSIVKEEPRPLTERCRSHPAELDRIVRKCLRKNREERYQSTLDLLVDLRSLKRELSTSSVSPAVGAQESADGLRHQAANPLTESTFVLTERICRKLNRATLDPRIIGDHLYYADNQVRSDVLVIFLHGLGLDHLDFEPILKRLAYRGLSPTLYGCEPDRRMRISLSLADHVVILREWLRHSLERLNPSIVVLVGWSLGADMGFEILVSPTGDELQVNVDAFLAMECNLCLDTCLISRVLAGIAPDRLDISIGELRRLGETATSLNEWLNIHEYLVKIIRKFQGNIGVLQRASADIVRPFKEAPGFEVFARRFRAARRRVSELRLIFAAFSEPALARLKLENLDSCILGEEFPEAMIVATPNADHFDLMGAERVLGHIDDLVATLRARERLAETSGAAKTMHPPQPAGKAMLVVLPFENLSRDQEQEYFSDGLTEEMITQLARLNPDRLGVIARTSSMRYKGTAKSIREIGVELGVNYVLEGSVRRSGEIVRITAQLVQVQDETHLWAETYERSLTDILKLQAEVSQAIAREAQVKLTSRVERRLAHAGEVSASAYEAYLKGRYLWNKRTEESMRRSVALFEQALASHPNYAMAYAGIADSYVMLACRGMAPAKDTFRKAKVAARKALELDHELGEAHGSLAHVRLHDWDWEGLERDFQRAIELNPANGIVYYWYGEFLMTLGRPDEAVAVTEKAYRTDPLSPVLGSSLAMILYLARRFDEAVHVLERTQEISPDHFLPHLRMGFVCIQRREYEKAIAELQAAVRLSGESTETQAALAVAYSAAGEMRLAQEIIDVLEKPSSGRYVLPYNIARIHAAAGNNEKALEWLEKAYDQASADLIELNSEPVFDGLRKELRFIDLMRHVGWSL